MKIFREINLLASLIAISACLILYAGCTSSSATTGDDPNSESIVGTWTLKSIQCLAVSSDNFLCWKNLLVPLGEVNTQSNSTSVLTLSDDGTYSGDMLPKFDTLPQNIFGCLLNTHSSKQHIDGTFSAAEGLIILHVVHYSVNGQKQDPDNDEEVVDGTYTVNSSALNITINLLGGERWKVNFTK